MTVGPDGDVGVVPFERPSEGDQVGVLAAERTTSV
jgi:hypothetical protein